jgi:hypothetical protein
LLIRTTGDIIALSPPLIIEKKHIDRRRGNFDRGFAGDKVRFNEPLSSLMTRRKRKKKISRYFDIKGEGRFFPSLPGNEKNLSLSSLPSRSWRLRGSFK